MCRLVAWATPEGVTLEQLIGTAQLEALRAVSSLHPDGWGAALAVDEGSGDCAPGLLVHRSTARAGADDDFVAMATATAARAGLVHLRRATDGFCVSEENTHPFVVDGWAFAHNGGIPHPERIDALTDPRWRHRRRGDTDSERYFLALLERVEARGDLLEGIRTAVADVRHACGSASMNAAIIGPGVMAVVHASVGASAPLAELIESVGGTPDCLPPGHQDRYYDLVYRQAEGGVIVSSTGMPDDTWRALPSESVLIADIEHGTFEVLPLVGALAESATS